MDRELTFRISAGLIFFALTMIRIYYMLVVGRLSNSLSIGGLGTPRAVVGLLFYVLILLLAVVYIFTPSWLAWAALPLPSTLRWFGVAIGVGSVLLLLWVHRTLGKNFAAPGIIQARQSLVTVGPYQWIRHPMYTTFFIISLTFALIAANGLIAVLCLLFGILLPSIARTDEQTLLEKFGEEYREYMQRTGRFLP
ncbi:MAG TPA: isoprenylcysteine carboxylmethyltransferase family protein [Anaerolineales bacterium]